MRESTKKTCKHAVGVAQHVGLLHFTALEGWL